MNYFLDTPSIKVDVSKNFIMEGETVNLYCFSRGYIKTTSMSWYKEDKKFISTRNESSLSIKMINVSRYDTGKYICSVQNEIENTSSEISLVISCKTFSLT